MAGIYLHIPFCRKLCYYCDFHFTVSMKQKQRVLDAIKIELDHCIDEFSGVQFSTIYFGGGTPSILTPDEINSFLEIINKKYNIKPEPEITIEANPDDLTNEYIKNIKRNTPINRLSIGVQSFNDDFLKLMNRRHSADEAISCVINSHEAGFDNINIDLIYGIPGMHSETWIKSLKTFSGLQVPHLSAYHLSIEPKTVFAHYQKKGKLEPVSEDESTWQFEYLIEYITSLDFDHYEISNFALPGYYSKHNLAYWTGEPYLGVGPSAHSYFMDKRRWNVANNSKYCEEIENGREGYYEFEIIDRQTGFNDYLITALRTRWGISMDRIETNFGKELLQYTKIKASKFIDEGHLTLKNNLICLSDKGKLIADYIIREMMLIK